MGRGDRVRGEIAPELRGRRLVRRGDGVHYVEESNVLVRSVSDAREGVETTSGMCAAR